MAFIVDMLSRLLSSSLLRVKYSKMIKNDSNVTRTGQQTLGKT